MAAGKQASLMGCISLMLPAGLQPLLMAIEGIWEIFQTSESLQYRTGSMVAYCFFFEIIHMACNKKKSLTNINILNEVNFYQMLHLFKILSSEAWDKLVTEYSKDPSPSTGVVFAHGVLDYFVSWVFLKNTHLDWFLSITIY